MYTSVYIYIYISIYIYIHTHKCIILLCEWFLGGSAGIGFEAWGLDRVESDLHLWDK